MPRVKWVVFTLTEPELFWLLDVERYSDKYQSAEPTDNTIEWDPGEFFLIIILFYFFLENDLNVWTNSDVCSQCAVGESRIVDTIDKEWT